MRDGEEIDLTFCAAVRSSARQVARFLAHCPSCIAAAWSVTVGTADFAEVTILPPGFVAKTTKRNKKEQKTNQCLGCKAKMSLEALR